MTTITQAMISPRRPSTAVDVAGVRVGGEHPVVVQSMTNTDTADIDSTVTQVAALARAGSELVRITVDRDEAAKAVPHIRERLLKRGVRVPLVGDFHYIGHKLLGENPACAEALVLADELGRLGLPVFLYGELADGRTRAELRKPNGLRGRTPDFGPRDLHPTAGATLVAARPKSPCVRKVYAYETASETELGIPYDFAPTTFVEIGPYLDKKLAAMACYVSQSPPKDHPRSVDHLRIRALYWGQGQYMTAAEPFVLLREYRR